MVEPAVPVERRVERLLARVAERRVADVVREAQRFGEVLVEPERAGDHPADLRDFEAVGQADAEVVAVGRDEHLGLAGEAAEGDRMDDPVAVALEGAARPAAAFVLLGELAPARGGGIGGVGGAVHGAWARVCGPRLQRERMGNRSGSRLGGVVRRGGGLLRGVFVRWNARGGEVIRCCGAQGVAGAGGGWSGVAGEGGRADTDMARTSGLRGILRSAPRPMRRTRRPVRRLFGMDAGRIVDRQHVGVDVDHHLELGAGQHDRLGAVLLLDR